ncbi:MAG: restriction endonuclease subunit S [Desulfobulbaceae bacterium]|nr:restriction endonuclease subunit S [Desulfobulbaceae bacterium]
MIADHLDIWTAAPVTKANGGRGRVSAANRSPYGIKKLRELILELAVRGMLVEQNPNDEPASVLLERIAKEKGRLTKEGKIKKQPPLPEINEEERPFELPEGWRFVRLGELTTRIGSGSTPRGGKSAYEEKGIPFLRSQNIWNHGLELEEVVYISDDTHQKMSNTVVEPNDILLNITGASLGRCTVYPEGIGEANVSQHVSIIRPTDSGTRFYLHLCILSPYTQSLVWDRQVGMAREGLSKKVLELFELPIPPLAEQHRIVAKVDELMALCDRLEQQQADSSAAHQTLVETLLATLATAADHQEFAEAWHRIAGHFDTLFTTEESIDQLKQTILQLAVQGKLVPQDPNDELASVLLEKIAKEKARLIKEGKIKKETPLTKITGEEEPFHLPKGWAFTRFENIVNITSGVTKGRKLAGRKVVSVPYLRVANVQRGFLELDLMKEIEIPKEELEKFTVLERDLLITEGGDWDKVGRTAIWRGELSLVAHQNHVFKARLIFEEQNELWLEKYLNSFIAREYFANSSKQTTNLASINKTQLRGCIVPIPPLAEQHRIVAKVDELMALCDQLKATLTQSQQQSEKLIDVMFQQLLVA